MKDQVHRHYLSLFAAVGAVGVISGLTLQGSNPYAGGSPKVSGPEPGKDWVGAPPKSCSAF